MIGKQLILIPQGCVFFLLCLRCLVFNPMQSKLFCAIFEIQKGSFDIVLFSLCFFFLTPLVGSEISVLYFDYINYQGLFITILNKTVNFE